MADLFKTGGTAGIAAYFAISDGGIASFSDGTNVLSISPATGWTLPAGATVFADVSAMADGAADIVVRDNVADALTVRQGSTAYITFRTTNDAEAIILGKPTLFTAMNITMSASPHSLVYGTAGANQTKIVGNAATVNAGAASRVLRLPPTADSAGYEIRIYNVGSDAFEVASSTGSTIVAAVASSKGVVLACNGSSWGQILSA